MGVLDRLIRPRSVAIVGASADVGKLTGRPLAYLEKYGFRGTIYPINPRYQTIGEHHCYPDAAALPQPPDVALVLLGADRVVEAVKGLAAIGTGAALVLASGFGESGEAGRALQDELKHAAGAMRLLGPNTIGLVNVTDRITLCASAALVTEEIIAGTIALVSQSGGILGSLLSRAQAQGVGFSKLVATGNECDLEVADFIDYLADDPATRVIALYLEGLRKPAAFRAAVLKARRAGKPVVAFKIGRSEAGARSAASHTGALAGADAAYDGLFKQLGIIRAERFSDLLDAAVALSCGRVLNGNRLAVITSTGGAGSLLADAAGMAGFETPPPDAPTQAVLDTLDIPGVSLDRNPIDVTLAGVKTEYFRRIIDAVAASASYDAVAVVLGSTALREPETVTVPLRECFARSDKPIVGFASPDAPHLVRELNLAGVPTFAGPEACAFALSVMRRIADAAPSPGLDERSGITAVSDRVRSLHRAVALNEAESKDLFTQFGITVTREIAAATPADAASAAGTFGGNVAVKILSREVTHKSEAGGVALDVPPAEVEGTAARMAEAFSAITRRQPEGFLIQEFVRGGVEMILGFKHDAQLGPLILLGAGGVNAELYNDTSLRLAPLSRADAKAMIDELRCTALLDGFRGRPRADKSALIEAILAFSAMALAIGDDLVEAEINPLLVLPEGRGAVAADGVVIVKSAAEKVSQA